MKIPDLWLDDIDADLLRHEWLVGRNGYARRCSFSVGRKSTILIHREVLSRILGRALTSADFTDHINRNRLDNRRSNLRLVSRSQNQSNRGKMKRVGVSKFIGVRRAGKKWGALIQVGAKEIWLGVHPTEAEAAAAYNRAAEKHGYLTRNSLA
jgi:HNH endonuclease